MKLQFFKILTLSLLIFSTSCKSKKINKIQKQVPSNEIVQISPCTGDNYRSDNETFRANAIGESSDQQVAKKKAFANARQELSLNINALINTVSDNFIQSSEYNNVEQITETFKDMSRTVASQRLNAVKEICGVSTNDPTTGKYKYYIAIELGSEDLLNNLNKTLSNDQVIKTEYNYERFKKTFESEMEKLNN